MKKLTRLLTLLLAVCLTATLSACVIGHSFSPDWQSDADNHWHACTEEGCEEKSDVAAHTYGEGSVTTPATEDAEGVMTYKCTVCGYEKTEAIEKLAHTHTEETIPGKAPTCTETGLTEGKKCSACGEILVAQEEIAANGHTEEVISGKAPTCTETGLTDGKKCTACGVTTVEQKEIAVKGHTDENGDYICDECKTDLCTSHVPAAAVEENRKESTCKVAGSYDSVVYCSVCNDELSRNTVALELAEHTEGEAVKEKVVAATCKAEGSYDLVVYCSVCTEKLGSESKTEPKLDHTPAEAVKENEKAASCTAEGSYDSVVKCSVCGEQLSKETITVPKDDHDTALVYDDASGHRAACKNCDYVSDKVAHAKSTEGQCECGYTCSTKCDVCGSCTDTSCVLCETKCAFLDTSKVVAFVPNTVFGKAEGPEGLAPGDEGAYLTDESIVAEHITLADGTRVTQFTLPNAVAAHTGVALRIDGDRYQAPGLEGYNCAIPMLANVEKPIRMYFTNNGTGEITFKYSLIDYYYDKGAVEVTLAAGESKTVILNGLYTKDTVGLNHQIVFPNGADAGASLTVRGEFVLDDNFSSISVATSANQLRFGVGEKFSAEGLVLKANGTNYTRIYISNNYITNLDGYTFTADDIGTKTVFVLCAGKSTTYQITVDDHDHIVEYIEATEPVQCEQDGVAAHYACTVDGCGKYFADAYGNELIDAPATTSCHTPTSAATLPGSDILCANCSTAIGTKSVDNWVLFTLPTAATVGSNIVNGKIEHATVNGMPGTKFYIGAGTVGSTNDSAFYLEMSNNESGYQTVIPNVANNAASGLTRTVVLYYENYSDVAITMNLQNDKGGSYGMSKVTIPANGSIVVQFTMTHTGGSNWFKYYVDCSPTTDVSFGVYGYMYFNDGEISTSSVGTSATKTTFNVGDTFSAEGLVLSATLNDSYGKVLYAQTGYTTDLDGYTFTTDDIGTHTVTVSFAGVTTTYEITVTADNYCASGNHIYEKVNDEALFVEMQGNDAIYNYACVLCGEASEETYVADTIAFVPHAASGTDYSLEYVTLEDGRIAAKLTFINDVSAGTTYVIQASKYPAGTNTAFPVSGNGRRVYMEMLSSADVNLTWQPEFYGDRDGVTMELKAGESQSAVWVIKYDTNASNTASALPYQEIVCNSAVSAGTEVYITGAFYDRGDVSDISIKTAASNVVFSVGDEFSTSGLTLKPDSTNSLFTNVTICNFTTNLDGHTFTADDLGVHTVTVSWGDFTYEYDILVIE